MRLSLLLGSMVVYGVSYSMPAADVGVHDERRDTYPYVVMGWDAAGVSMSFDVALRTDLGDDGFRLRYGFFVWAASFVILVVSAWFPSRGPERVNGRDYA